MNTNVLRAVFTRNFVAYFANPTGYVFICVFVLLSSFAAFWPYEFFNSNLANLDQLNSVFPFIMLIFIPAITMSCWAEERRQGTDELLLTIPAADFDIVLGKYLAAMAIYTVSLLFSLVCNYVMLWWLSEGHLDVGLFLGTYVGYWLVGLAMVAVGMVASFLTGNLTVAFILGTVFNAPLVFAVASDAIFGPDLARLVKQWSIGEQFRDFGQGLITLSGVAYFAAIVVVMLYLSMVLIGRRHWMRGRDWLAMGGHYALRTVSLVVVAVVLVFFAQNEDLRSDVTTEKLSSLSPATQELLKDLKLSRPIQIEAFISPVVPESYVQSRLNLLAMLRELQARGGSEVQVRIHNTERFGAEAARAEERFNITPRRVVSMTRGTMAEEYIFLGAAFTCGLEKVILPFIDRGIPVEYELVRSICTVSQQKRKKIGILQTDAQLYGRFNMQTMSSSSNWPIVSELEKMYDVVQVDPANPITERYDALLAVQPSSLGPQEMSNFIQAVRSGQPTAIFEDPFPGFAGEVPATTAPRQAPGGDNPMMAMMGRQPPPEKGNIGELWNLLGVDFTANQVVWQNYNPYPKLGHLPPELVFVDTASSKSEPFNQADPISSKLQLLLFPFPGAISKLNASSLDFEPLVHTGEKTGTVDYGQMFEMSMFGPRGLNPNRPQRPTNTSYILAARIQGKIPANKPMADEGGAGEPAAAETAPAAAAPVESTPAAAAPAETAAPAAVSQPGDAPAPETAAPAAPATTPETGAAPGVEAAAGAPAKSGADAAAAAAATGQPPAPAAKPKDAEINVVVVADIDMLHREFFMLREQGDNPEAGIDFNFDNVTFVLNTLDTLAGDTRFVEIRKRRPQHRTLVRIDQYVEEARQETAKSRESLQKKFAAAQSNMEQDLNKQMDKLREDMKKEKIDEQEIMHRVALALKDGQRKMQTQVDQLQQDQDREVKRIETKQALEIRGVQDRYKLWAVMLPPIPPLLVGLGVLITRRKREREGVARSRLR